jgi:rhamnosyltransferase
MAVSQEQYKEIFSGVKSENEGIKLVKNSMKYLIEQKKYFYIPDLIFQSGFKYLGYKAGRKYKKLPISVIKKISLNPGYWK